MERDQSQDPKHAGGHPYDGDGSAENGPADVSRLGGGPRAYTEGAALTVRKAMVDHGPNGAASHLHALEEPRSHRTPRGTEDIRAGGVGKRSREAVPRCHPTAKEEALERVPCGQRQHLEGREVHEVWRRHSL